MAKKILFIINDFGMGGAEKVLIDISKILVDNGFEVDVLTFFDRGALSEDMRKVCKVFKLFDSKFHFLVIRKLRLYRKYLINSFVKKHKYDSVVSFMEGQPTILLSDVDASVNKVAWVHSDFTKLDIGLSRQEIQNIYSQIDKVVCVSRDAERAFLKYISPVSIASRVIYNVINEDNIDALSNEKEVSNDVFTFLTVGMLRKEKRHDRLIRVASRLKSNGYCFQIHIIGDGPLRTSLEVLIAELEVEEEVVLLGLKKNPYPYIKACDCFVLTSDFEGYGIVIKEALFFQKLVVTTDVVGPREILVNGKYGLIVDAAEEPLFKKIKEILDGKNTFTEIRSNIKQYRGDNEEIKQQLYELFS